MSFLHFTGSWVCNYYLNNWFFIVINKRKVLHCERRTISFNFRFVAFYTAFSIILPTSWLYCFYRFSIMLFIFLTFSSITKSSSSSESSKSPTLSSLSLHTTGIIFPQPPTTRIILIFAFIQFQCYHPWQKPFHLCSFELFRHQSVAPNHISTSLSVA